MANIYTTAREAAGEGPDEPEGSAPPTTAATDAPASALPSAAPPLSPAAPGPTGPAWLGVLRHRAFRNVWLGAFGSSIGGWMEIVGVQWVMTVQTLSPEWVASGRPGATLMLGYLSAAQLGPTLALGLWGGLVADRVDRKRLLLVTQVVMMLIAAALLVASAAGRLTPAVMLVLSLLNGVAMAFNMPAWQVLTPRLVPREELTKAITLNGMQFNMARVIGPGLAGVLMAQFGATVLFAVNTLSFLGVLLAVSSTPPAPPPPREDVKAWSQIREALRFTFRQRGPLAIFTALVLFSALAAPLVRMLPVFVQEVYHAEERVYGLLLALMGAGAVVGGLSLKWLPPWYPKHHFIPLSVLGGGAMIAAFSVMDSVLGASVFIFLCGAFWLWAFNSCMAAMQLLVDDRMRGRVMAVCNTAVFGVMPLGAIAAGWISHIASGRADSGLGTQVGVGTLGAVLAAAGLVMLIWRTPEVDGLRPGDPGYERRPSLLAGITARAHRPGPQ